MKTGDRIKELRKSKDLTQLELAEKLNVTDKAVSKWENNHGEPSIDLLLELSKLFDVSIDYLITGDDREKIIKMSDLEKIAYYDNPDDINKSLATKDEKGKTLIDYVYQYEAEKTFLFIANKERDNEMLIKNRWDSSNYLTDLIKMSLITNYYNLLDVDIKQPFIPFYKVNISRDYSKKIDAGHLWSNPICGEEIIDFILHSEKMNDNAWKYLLDTSSLYWGKGLTKILELAVKENAPITEKILNVIEPFNQSILEKIESSYDKNTKLHGFYLSNFSLYKRTNSMNEKPLMIHTNVTKETVLYALENNDYDLAERLNKLSDFKVSEYELKMDKIYKDKTLSQKDKNRASVIHNGLVHIDELIKTDDYDLYLELIEYPASELEKFQNMVKNKEYKKVFDYAIKMDFNRTLDVLRKNQIEKLNEALKLDFNNIEYEANAKYLYGMKKYNGKESPIGKKTILFKDIIGHKDYRFFSHAAKTDSSKLDWALETIIKDRSEEYKLQKTLLDLGAKLHKRWSEDDGWGYTNNIDEVDDVGTEILKNQIKILLKEGNTNE
jgi:transcriptional regulator with XRE-family HTH domain